MTDARGPALNHDHFDSVGVGVGDDLALGGPVGPDIVDGAQGRGFTFIEPDTRVYEGMIVGLNSRSQDIPINVCKEKKKTNIRASTSDIAIRLTPPLKMSLEQAIDFISDDELVEVTPKNIRLRKKLLTYAQRLRDTSSVSRSKR